MGNVNPIGRCLESQLGACACVECDELENEKINTPNKDLSESVKCTAPRTWVIGSCIHFCNPHSRKPGLVRSGNSHGERAVRSGSSSVRREQVAPECKIEMKTQE